MILKRGFAHFDRQLRSCRWRTRRTAIRMIAVHLGFKALQLWVQRSAALRLTYASARSPTDLVWL